jgi:Zn-dependent protease
MEPSPTGSFRLFRAAGIDVYLHWSWFIVAWLQISMDRPGYGDAYTWKVGEYVTLFGIVGLHEFGHALACRQVGGQAERIVLWPLGGIAYVSPPARPGAVLWSIIAGPLVNFVLLAPTGALCLWAWSSGWAVEPATFVQTIALMNAGLLVLNLLPIYPLDGGQVLHALLWYVVGRWRSLLAVSIVGGGLGVLFFVGSILFALVALALGTKPLVPIFAFLLAVVAVFMAVRSFSAFQLSRHMLQIEGLPRHSDFACPGCHISPPCGPFWVCEHCETRFDTFRTRGQCPGCGAWYLETGCPHCRTQYHIDQWAVGRPAEAVLGPVAVPPAAEKP